MTRAGLAIALAFTLLAAACSSSTSSTTAPATASGPTIRFVTLGGSATEGDGIRDRLHQAWPYVVFRGALPESTTLVNAATDDGRAATALAEQVPVARETKPDIVALWIGADDARARTPLSEFRTAFTQIIDGLHESGVRRVIVGTIPKTYGAVAAYNDVLRVVAANEHAELVELERAPVALAATDGQAPQPDATGHQVVANAFERAVKK